MRTRSILSKIPIFLGSQSRVFRKHTFHLFKSDLFIDSSVTKFFRDLDTSFSMLFEIKFYKGFMMKILSAECLVFLKIQKVSRNYIKIALLFFDNQVEQNAAKFR